MMQQRKKTVRLVVDGLPANKKALVKDYVASTDGKLMLHFLPGYRSIAGFHRISPSDRSAANAIVHT